MPEHTPETFDLDSAFDTLTTDVRVGTASRGAEHAIGAARRRRTTIGAAAAVALIAIGGVVFSQLGGSDKLSPAGELTVPSPAALDAAAMNAATSEWVSGWHVAGQADTTVLEALDSEIGCFTDANGGESPDPKRVGNNLMVAGGEQVSFSVFADYGQDSTAAGASLSEITAQFRQCAGTITSAGWYGDRGSVGFFDVTSSGSRASQQAWVARLDNRIGILMVVGAQGEPSTESISALGAAIMAALQDDASYVESDALTGEGSASGSASASAGPASEAPSPALNQVDERALAASLSGWSSWAIQGNSTAQDFPCLSDSPGSSTSGMSTTVGTTGEQSFNDFASSSEAAKGMQSLLALLASCDSASWTLDSTTVPGAVVASYDGGVVWVAQAGRTVTAFKLGDAGTPPADVAVAVGKLVISSLTDRP